MDKIRKWVKQLLRDNQDSLLIEAAKEVGIDIYKVLTIEEIEKMAGARYDPHLDERRKDRDPA